MRPTRLILLAVAVVAALTMLAWRTFWVQPQLDCLNHHGVWDAHDRACAKAVSISPDMTPSVPVPYDSRSADSHPGGSGH